MTLVTLISDFGNKDYYVPALKGNLISCIPDIQIVDVTHEITSHDIIEASFVLKNTFASFPDGTIHICYVKNHEQDQKLIFTKINNQYFIGPDNGIFSLVFDEISQTPIDYYQLPENVYMPFRELGELVRSLSQGKPLLEIGTLCHEIKERIGLAPIVYQDQIRGSIVHIDKYGNLIINVKADLFESTRKGRGFKIYFKRLDPITRISSSFVDVPVGEPVCLINTSGYLVIGVHMGNAADLLSLRKEEIIQIIFEG